MRHVGGQFKYSATDLVNHLACVHLTGRSAELALGRVDGLPRVAGGHDLIARFGDDHEQRCLDHLRVLGLQIAEIETARDWASVEAAAARTVEAMRDGVDVVFQATFVDGSWSGHADFLVRVPHETDLGPWGYEPVDAKLARTAKVRAMLQLGEYAALVEAVQGAAVRNVHLWLGSDRRFSFPVADLAPFHRRARERLLGDVTADLMAVYPEPCSHCSLCRWMPQCEQRRRDDDHLTFVAGIRSGQIQKLRTAGTLTMTALARRPDPPAGMLGDIFERLRAQARLQVAARDGEHRFEVIDPTEREEGGFRRLPAPSPHDLFFDLEGNPFGEDGGIEYLWGISDRSDGYREWWAHAFDEERWVFEEIVDVMIAMHRDHPDAHVYHYAHHEETTLKRLAGRYATRESELDVLLRAGVLVDLYAVVRGAVRCSTESYSLKEMERFYWDGDGREGEVKSGFESIVMYERWRDNGDESLLHDIASYNKEDCVSTRALADWLEDRRDEAIAEFGDVPRPDMTAGEAPELVGEREERVDGLRSRLLAARDLAPVDELDVAADSAALDSEVSWLPQLVDDEEMRHGSAEAEALWLLSYLVDFHRREEKAEWWAYFARSEMDAEELREDSEAIADLEYEGEIGPLKRSIIHRFRFDPDQPYKLKVGENPHDPATGKAAGRIHEIDPIDGTIDLLRGNRSDAPLPRNLIPSTPVITDGLKDALEAVAGDVADGGFSASSFPAIADLLLRKPPDAGGADLVTLAAEAGDRMVEAGLRLRRSCLPVQGPPGAGKTYNSAQLIARLAAEGKKVAVSANSHRVICNLLEEVASSHSSVRVLKVGGDDPDVAGIDHHKDAQRGEDLFLAGDYDVVGATAWFCAREGVRGQFDVLIVDEAGQFSLANTVASATCATSLVLVGDPQQLDQPTKGSHPPGVDRSALAHVLGGERTIPDDRGIFLDSTRRLHPDICDFVSETSYEGRLVPHELCAQRGIDGITHGLRWRPVTHTNNSSRSREESHEVATIVTDLLGRTFVDHDGSKRPLSAGDIMVITPYNAQVRELRAALPEDVEIGTVDLFQGREAPVVVLSLASSSADDAPRGLGFLLDRRRLNVAVSRAQRLAVVVGSPAVLDSIPAAVGQIPLVSGVCRFVEAAE